MFCVMTMKYFYNHFLGILKKMNFCVKPGLAQELAMADFLSRMKIRPYE